MRGSLTTKQANANSSGWLLQSPCRSQHEASMMVRWGVGASNAGDGALLGGRPALAAASCQTPLSTAAVCDDIQHCPHHLSPPHVLPTCGDSAAAIRQSRQKTCPVAAMAQSNEGIPRFLPTRPMPIGRSASPLWAGFGILGPPILSPRRPERRHTTVREFFQRRVLQKKTTNAGQAACCDTTRARTRKSRFEMGAAPLAETHWQDANRAARGSPRPSHTCLGLPGVQCSSFRSSAALIALCVAACPRLL